MKEIADTSATVGQIEIMCTLTHTPIDALYNTIRIGHIHIPTASSAGAAGAGVVTSETSAAAASGAGGVSGSVAAGFAVSKS